MLTLPSELLDAVDSTARRLGRKRSQLVRQALQEWIERQRQREFEALLAEGYQEMAQQAAELSKDGLLLQATSAEGIWRWDE